jgi:hypothetical protein
MLTKTKCKVFIYDPNCEPLHAAVDVDIFEQGGYQILGYGTTGPMRRESAYGIAIDLWLNPAPIAVVVSDDARRYATNTYQNLNGSVSSRLDLTLYELPVEPGVFGDGGPRILDDDVGFSRITHLQHAVRQQDHWTAHQKKAVQALIATYVGFVTPIIIRTDRDNSRLLIVARRCEKALAHLGIATKLLAPEPTPERRLLAH